MSRLSLLQPGWLQPSSHLVPVVEKLLTEGRFECALFRPDLEAVHVGDESSGQYQRIEVGEAQAPAKKDQEQRQVHGIPRNTEDARYHKGRAGVRAQGINGCPGLPERHDASQANKGPGCDHDNQGGNPQFR